MQTPGTFDVQLRTNTSYSQPITYNDANGNVVNLSGYSARMQIRNALSSAVLLELNTVNGDIALASTSPNITWTLTTTQIGTLPIGQWVYDFCLFSGSGYTGTETCLLTGAVVVVQGITE